MSFWFCVGVLERLFLNLHSRWAREDAGDDEDEDEEAEDGNRKQQRKRKPQKKKKKKNGSAKKKTKATKPSKNGAKKDAAETSSLYKAGDYQKKRMKFIQRRRAVGWTYREACDDWNASACKAKLLAGLSQSELKRRRFI